MTGKAARRNAKALQLYARGGISLYAATGAADGDYKSLRRLAKRHGMTTHDHCLYCGRTDHRSVNGRCSPSHLAAMDVIDRGIAQSTAARRHGISSSAVSNAVKRIRRIRLRESVRQ